MFGNLPSLLAKRFRTSSNLPSLMAKRFEYSAIFQACGPTILTIQ
jgi:hypothetical protein